MILVCYLYFCFGYALFCLSYFTEFAVITIDLLFILVFQKCVFCVCHTSLSLMSVLLILYFCCTERQRVISVYDLVSRALLLENAKGYIENV